MHVFVSVCQYLSITFNACQHVLIPVYACQCLLVTVNTCQHLSMTVYTCHAYQHTYIYICLISTNIQLLWQGRGALQDIDQMALFKPLCKYTATVTSVRDIAPTLRHAIQVAQSGTPGK